MARRVSGVGLLVEQKPDVNYRRVSGVGLLVEQKPDVNYRRVSAIGLMVETKPFQELLPSSISSGEAWGEPIIMSISMSSGCAYFVRKQLGLRRRIGL